MAVIVAIAEPLTTVVPLKIKLSSLVLSLNTAKDSPVSMDSFTEKSWD